MLILPSAHGFVGAGSNPTFDAAQLGTGVVLLNGGTTAQEQTNNTWASARGLKSNNSGKKYVEFVLGAGSLNEFSGSAVGAVPSSFNVNTVVGQGSSRGVYFDGTGWSYLDQDGETIDYLKTGAQTPGDIIRMMIDFANATSGGANIYLGYNNVWHNSGTATLDQSGFTYELVLVSGTTLFPAVTVQKGTSTGAPITLVTKAPFTYSLPSGATAWG